MDFNDLFLSCRKGDLARIKFLVEQKEIDLNVRDKWDSTPLYYACLCGHMDVVKYLLENGARCEANTFDGERCLYGALNTDIRNTLRNFKVVTSKSLCRDRYDEFLRKCLEGGEYSDVLFIVHREEFAVHRCILAARCEYFCEMLLDKWKNKDVIHIVHPRVTIAAFRCILQYIYTGRLETHIDHVEDCIILARQCQLHGLIQQIEDAVRKVKSFQCTKPGTNVTTILIEPSPESTELQQDFGILAEQAIPLELNNWVGGEELPFINGHLPFADLIFSVHGFHFRCHKVFFCSRSDFFKALLADHFSETQNHGTNDTPVFTLHNVSPDVFLQVVLYMYQNVTELTPANVYDVLCASDLYLLPGLKRQCAVYIAQHLDVNNVVTILKTARLFELPRLEDQCAEFIARHLEEVINCSEFHTLIEEDAQDVKQRQETDSISIIDDIRYHITSNVQTFSAMAEANDKLNLIDDLLEQMGLDA